MVRRAPWLLVWLAGCFPGPLSVAGRLCSEERSCGAGFVCLAGQCATEGTGLPLDAGLDDAGTDDAGIDDAGLDDAGLVNLLANPGFEELKADGGLNAWHAAAGLLSWAPESRDGGARSGSLQARTVNQPIVLSDPAGGPQGPGAVYCAQIWVRSGSDAGLAFTLSVRARISTDAGSDAGATYDTCAHSAVVPTVDWAPVQMACLTSFATDSVELRVLGLRLGAGDALLIDDAFLALAPGVTCVFP